MQSLAELKKSIEDKITARTAYQEEAGAEIKRRNAEISEAERIYLLALAGLNIEIVKKAEEILFVRGLENFPQGADMDCVNDALKWFSGAEMGNIYLDLKQYAFGTKNYGRWTHQREDHQYGYGPRHGSTVFAIGLQEPSRELSAEERDACIYYLESLKQGFLSKKQTA